MKTSWVECGREQFFLIFFYFIELKDRKKREMEKRNQTSEVNKLNDLRAFIVDAFDYQAIELHCDLWD